MEENISLLSLAVVLLAASPPLVAAAWVTDRSRARVECGESGSTYGANSTYEANLRHLAAVLPAETSASRAQSHAVDRAIGYWPNRVQARATCWRRGGGDGGCAACIAEAFREVERVCPFRREASFFGRDCYLRHAEFRISSSIDVFGKNELVQTLAMVMIFQAFGLACLLFFFIQAWRRDGKKGTMTRHTPLLLSRDQ